VWTLQYKGTLGAIDFPKVGFQFESMSVRRFIWLNDEDLLAGCRSASVARPSGGISSTLGNLFSSLFQTMRDDH
jgi:hypothetical protein